MKKNLIPLSLLLLSNMFSISAFADNLVLKVEIPRLNVAEYHNPYLAIWLEDSSRKATQIALWYDVKMHDNEGQEWLKDLRQWWRRGGRGLTLPYDGLTSATRGPGQHNISIPVTEKISHLPAGNYRLRIEAAREVGGRELLELPITLPLSPTTLPLSAQGNSELGTVSLTLQSQ